MWGLNILASHPTLGLFSLLVCCGGWCYILYLYLLITLMWTFDAVAGDEVLVVFAGILECTGVIWVVTSSGMTFDNTTSSILVFFLSFSPLLLISLVDLLSRNSQEKVAAFRVHLTTHASLCEEPSSVIGCVVRKILHSCSHLDVMLLSYMLDFESQSWNEIMSWSKSSHYQLIRYLTVSAMTRPYVFARQP